MATAEHIRFEGLPRLLTKKQAAIYCGVSVATFDRICPIPPLSLGQSRRLDRFDKLAIDAWISGQTFRPREAGDWLRLLDDTNV